MHKRNIEWLSLEFIESVGLRSSELRVSLESFLSHVDVLKAENAALRYSVQALQSNTSEIMKQLTLILSLLQNNSKCFVSPDKSIEDSSSQDSSPDSSQKNAFDTIMNTPQSNEMTSIKDSTLSQALFQSLNTSASITVGMSSSHASQLRRCLRYMHYFSTDEEKSILQTKRPRNTTDEFLIWKKNVDSVARNVEKRLMEFFDKHWSTATTPKKRTRKLTPTIMSSYRRITDLVKKRLLPDFD